MPNIRLVYTEPWGALKLSLDTHINFLQIVSEVLKYALTPQKVNVVFLDRGNTSITVQEGQV